MKKISLLLLCVTIAYLSKAQSLITMSNKCMDMMKAGDLANTEGRYEDAVKTFEDALKKCTARDAKERGNVGMAHALNGLGRHEDAIVAANAAIKASKQTNIAGFFERADANYSLRNGDAAKADFEKIISLSEKNKNISERASIYAKLGELSYRMGNKDSADYYLVKASETDPQNPEFYILRGDLKAKQGDLNGAFTYYDKALETTADKNEVYKLRALAFTRAMQEKHGTKEEKELKSRMSKDELSRFCGEWKRLFDSGYKNMKQDLYYTMICQ
ncbi:tetratricopeptide repeat protein [Flavihumibacter rivuli]|uniref:tetratricopeptide repeat protein n=1 Tax=Flavihumibacter rivuli TaxID=2838156 RepID=UPI001BDDF79D|nr:tetratricopeptide repeat protein [Flavihumibacter rivuli]ULQ55395.1 tetratricopeptide repeat protein [Flavihumibacter rivuli]